MQIDDCLERLCSAFLACVGQSKPGILYHFCTHKTAEKILSSGVLWACDLRKSKNDPHELECGYKLLEEVVAERQDLIKSHNELDVAQEFRTLCFHIACLSSELTVRSQWEDYADGGAGCAIGFAHDELEALRREEGIDFLPVVYEAGTRRGNFRSLLDVVSECRSQLHNAGFVECVLALLAGLANTTKCPKYACENEWRLLVSCDDHFERENREICTRKLPICTSETIHEVVMGPNSLHQLDTMEHYLGEHRYERAKVRRIAQDDLTRPLSYRPGPGGAGAANAGGRGQLPS